MSTFWSVYVTVLTLGTIFAMGWLLIATRKLRAPARLALFGALGWEQYQGQAEVLCPYFESSGTGQVVVELPVEGRVVPSLGLEMPVS